MKIKTSFMLKKLLILMLLIASISFASNIVYMQIDNDGYVLDITKIATQVTGYEQIALNTKVPYNVMCGCYKFDKTTGKFILDEVKYKAYLADIAKAREAEKAQQGDTNEN